jgi:hypothetical protein
MLTVVFGAKASPQRCHDDLPTTFLLVLLNLLERVSAALGLTAALKKLLSDL